MPDEFIDVTLPEPVGEETIFFFREPEERSFSRKELEQLLDEMKSACDHGISELRTGKYSVASYKLSILRKKGDTYQLVGDILEGGLMINMDASSWSMGDFERRYGASFEEVRKEIEDENMIYTDLFFVACRDSVPVKVKARNPEVDS